jgi:predicted O-methyltransferase YrrM
LVPSSAAESAGHAAPGGSSWRRIGRQFGLVLVDGSHEYEFASFDIDAAPKRLERGGFIVIDNVSQAGPYCRDKGFPRAGRPSPRAQA